MKVHMYRSERSTWCGRKTELTARQPVKGVTRVRELVTCVTCLRANAAEQRKEDAASR